ILNLHNNHYQSTNIQSTLVHAYDSTNVNYLGAVFGSGYTRLRNEFRLRGTGAEVLEIEVLRGQKEQFFDIFSAMEHEASNTQARTFARGVLSERSQAVFKGMVSIPPEVPKCNSYLSLHGLLMDKTARFHTIPAMEIANSDVKAGHAATVSQIDPEAVFYFETRGMTREIARKLISEGYVQPAIRELADHRLQDLVVSICRRQWYGIENSGLELWESEWERNSEGEDKQFEDEQE
ncbi:MAG TPA: SufD family Fe-S cluster assembly protein, partial [Candidatus Hodarchaeales archaeon]|nr:SufD family Fe-S cluster assembly protein [Candidatus Hodarchaeales archaeon]